MYRKQTKTKHKKISVPVNAIETPNIQVDQLLTKEQKKNKEREFVQDIIKTNQEMKSTKEIEMTPLSIPPNKKEEKKLKLYQVKNKASSKKRNKNQFQINGFKINEEQKTPQINMLLPIKLKKIKQVQKINPQEEDKGILQYKEQKKYQKTQKLKPIKPTELQHINLFQTKDLLSEERKPALKIENINYHNKPEEQVKNQQIIEEMPEEVKISNFRVETITLDKRIKPNLITKDKSQEKLVNAQLEPTIETNETDEECQPKPQEKPTKTQNKLQELQETLQTRLKEYNFTQFGKKVEFNKDQATQEQNIQTVKDQLSEILDIKTQIYLQKQALYKESQEKLKKNQIKQQFTKNVIELLKQDNLKNYKSIQSELYKTNDNMQHQLVFSLLDLSINQFPIWFTFPKKYQKVTQYDNIEVYPIKNGGNNYIYKVKPLFTSQSESQKTQYVLKNDKRYTDQSVVQDRSNTYNFNKKYCNQNFKNICFDENPEIMEQLDRDLSALWEEPEKLTPLYLKQILQELMQIVHRLAIVKEEYNITHNDIKADNILVYHDNQLQPKLVLFDPLIISSNRYHKINTDGNDIARVIIFIMIVTIMISDNNKIESQDIKQNFNMLNSMMENFMQNNQSLYTVHRDNLAREAPLQFLTQLISTRKAYDMNFSVKKAKRFLKTVFPIFSNTMQQSKNKEWREAFNQKWVEKVFSILDRPVQQKKQSIEM